jgi:hypothetical protein
MKSNNSWLLSQRLLWVGAEGQLETMDPPSAATIQGDFVQRKTAQAKTEAVAGKGRRANNTVSLGILRELAALRTSVARRAISGWSEAIPLAAFLVTLAIAFDKEESCARDRVLRSTPNPSLFCFAMFPSYR